MNTLSVYFLWFPYVYIQSSFLERKIKWNNIFIFLLTKFGEWITLLTTTTMTITTAATTTPPPLPFFYEPYWSFACIASKREDNRIMGLLTQLSDVTPLCVKINTIFTQMLENKRTFVSRTIQYLHRCLKTNDLCVKNNIIFTKDPLFWSQNWRKTPVSLLLVLKLRFK